MYDDTTGNEICDSALTIAECARYTGCPVCASVLLLIKR